MNKDQFLDLELTEQVAYLNGQLDEGKEFDDILATLELDKRSIGAYGLYFVKGKVMGKPMRGYQTNKRSGNEHSNTGSAALADQGKGAIL